MKLLAWIYLLALGFCGSLQAAEFRCVSDKSAFGRVIVNPRFSSPLGFLGEEPFMWEKGLKEKDFCTTVTIEGKISVGDADKLEWLLVPSAERGPAPTRFNLLSPGGSVFEAMTMGRLFRSANASVHSSGIYCGGQGKPVCCASACAIAYLGATQWDPKDRIGLHRPTLDDLDALDYQEAQKALIGAAQLIRKYLQEMEADDKVYDMMMRADPDRIAVYTIGKSYPPFLDDWLTAKCKKFSWVTPPTQEDIDFCKSSDHASLRSDTPEGGKDFEWFSHKSTRQLEEMTGNWAVGAIRRVAVDKELASRLLKDRQPRIDAMSVEELRKYIRKNFDRATKEEVLSIYAYDRLEILTGDRIVGKPYSDCVEARSPEIIVASCTEYISKTEDERLRLSTYDEWPLATIRRSDALRTLRRDSEALADLDTVLGAIETNKIKSWILRTSQAELHAKRADLRQVQGNLPAVIEDLTQAIRFTHNTTEKIALIRRRADVYARTSQPDKAAADQALANKLLKFSR